MVAAVFATRLSLYNQPRIGALCQWQRSGSVMIGGLVVGEVLNLKVRMQSHTVHGRNPVNSPVEVTLVVEIPLFTTVFFFHPRW